MTLPPLLLVFALFTLNPVTISVYPHVSGSPATFRMTVLTPRHAANRSLCLSYHLQIAPEIPIRRSCHTMAGDTERRVRTVYWDVRESGEFEASAILTRMEDGREKTYRSTQPFRVIGLEPF